MKSVLDASAFFSDIPFEGELYTTPDVVAELRDLRSKARCDLLIGSGLRVWDPDPAGLSRVREAAGKSGEACALSGTDVGVLALALQIGAAVRTDDYALQNVARVMGIPVRPILQKGARNIRWRYRCSGCKKYYPAPGQCPICGATVERNLK